MLGGERGGEGLDAEPRPEVGVAGRRAGEQMARAEAARVDVHEAPAVVEPHPHARVQGLHRGIYQQRPGHP